MELLDITEISEIESCFSLTFSLELMWRDQHLNFNFLKDNQAKNIITNDNIWRPRTQLLELKEQDLLNSQFFVEKGGRPRLSNHSDSLWNNETYEGKDNVIHYQTILTAKFKCAFNNVKNYPFGSQNCSFKGNKQF